MEKLSFCLPCQLSMSLVVKTVPESTEDFVILKTASRGTESSRPDHHGDDRYNIWINIQIKIRDFKVPSLKKKKKNQNKVQLHLISCCHILKHCQWKCHLGRASNAHATPVCMLEHKTNLYRVFKEVTKNYSHWLYEKLHIWKKKSLMWYISPCGNTLPSGQDFSQKCKYSLLFKVQAFQTRNPRKIYLLLKATLLHFMIQL